MIIVQWKEPIDIPDVYWEEDITPDDLFKEYNGKVIGTHRSWFGTYLVVACDDGDVREVKIEYVKYIK